MPTRKGISPGNNAHKEGNPVRGDASRWDTHWKGCPLGMMHLQLPRSWQLENKGRGGSLCPLCPVTATSGQVWGAWGALSAS